VHILSVAGSTKQRGNDSINPKLCKWIFSLFVLSILLVQVLLMWNFVFFTMKSNQHDNYIPNKYAQNQRNDAKPTTTPGQSAPYASINSHTSQLPQWIQNYLAWHNAMISQFPGTQLLTDPNAPKLLVRVCLGLCGGLHDRLGQLPWDLYLANQTQRLLLLRWERPRPLENFLVPNEFNWSFPGTKPAIQSFKRDVNHYWRSIPQLFEGYLDEAPEAQFWKISLDHALQRATTGEFRNEKILRHRLLGHLDENILEGRLKALGESDMLHDTPSFGHIFWAFFRPSDPIQNTLQQIYQKYNLRPQHYHAVHCRVRHPKATPKHMYVKGKSNSDPADKTGLPWYGNNKEFAVATATKAIYCARTLMSQKQQQEIEPLYFFSDSNDLVRYMAHKLSDSKFQHYNASLLQNATDVAALHAINGMPATSPLVARDSSEENAHIDRQKGRRPEQYYGTFIDFFLAIHAQCVTYGIGYFAIFAVKISGTSCKLVYQEEEWGGRYGTKGSATKCTEDTYRHLLPSSAINTG
jgi:hypothetical protein